MFLDPTTESDLLVNLRAHRIRQANLSQIGLDGGYATAGRQRTNVHHKNFVLRQFLHLQGNTTVSTTVLKNLSSLHKQEQSLEELQ